MSDHHLSKLTLRRDAASVAPLIEVLNPAAPGARLNVDHKLLWTAMPEHIRLGRAGPDAEPRSAFLWRRDSDEGRFYLLGPRPAADTPFFDVETTPFAPVLAAGDRLAFDLRANATVDRKIGVDGAGKAVRQRVDVAMDLMTQEKAAAGGGRGWYAPRRQALAEAAAEAWLHRQGIANGFRLEALHLDAYRTQMVPRGARSKARFGVLDLRGVLTVTEPQAFLRRLLAGFGRAKAFGCGLMLIRRSD